MVLQDIFHRLFDPCGRIDRKGLIAIAGVVFGAQIIVYGSVRLGLAEADGAPVRTFEFATLWICLAAATKRLHDIGLGAAWIAAAIGATFGVSLATATTGIVLFGPVVVETGSNGYWSIVSLTALPALLATLWLHCRRGEQGDNRFGPQPGPLGFSHAMNARPVAGAVDVT